LFQLHMKVFKNESMCHGSISCLTQLSSLNGPVLDQPGQAVNYLTRFVQGFLHAFAKYDVISINLIFNFQMFLFCITDT